MNMTQPAISSAIKSLEAECDTALFHRHNNVLSLTDAGAILLDEVTKLLTHYDRLNHVAKELQLSRNFIRIGLSTLSGTQVYPEILSCYNEKHPEIKVYSIEESTSRQFEMLERDELDFIITIKRFNDTDKSLSFNDVYEHLLLKKTRLLFCVCSDYPIADYDKIPLSKIADIPLVMLNDNYNQAKRIKSIFKDNGLSLNIMHTTNQMYTIERFIEKGICGGFLPEEIVEQNSRLKGFPYDDSVGRIELFWKKRKYQFYAEKEFIRVARTFKGHKNNL